MTKIRFIKRAFAETEGRGKGVTHEEGAELDLPFTSAFRWIRRGYAVELPLAKGPGLRLNRPMMGSSAKEASETMTAVAEAAAKADPPKDAKPAASANGEDKPKRRGRKPAARKDAG